MYITPTSPWKTATTKFVWVTPFCHKKLFITKHDVYFCKHRYHKPQREGISYRLKKYINAKLEVMWLTVKLVKTEPYYLARIELFKKGYHVELNSLMLINLTVFLPMKVFCLQLLGSSKKSSRKVRSCFEQSRVISGQNVPGNGK